MGDMAMLASGVTDMVSTGLDMVTTMASVKPKLNQRLKLKLTQHFCTALTAMVLDTMAMLVWDTMAMLVWDTMVTLVLDISATVMVLAMVITMERGKLNLLLKLLLRLKLTQLCFTAAMDMASGITAMLGLDITAMLVLDTLAMLVLVIMDMADILAMATMASVQHRWCNIFSCHCSESKESQTFIESDEIVIKEQIVFPKSLFLFYSFLSH